MEFERVAQKLPIVKGIQLRYRPLGGFGLLGPLGGFGVSGPLGGFGLLGPFG